MKLHMSAVLIAALLFSCYSPLSSGYVDLRAGTAIDSDSGRSGTLGYIFTDGGNSYGLTAAHLFDSDQESVTIDGRWRGKVVTLYRESDLAIITVPNTKPHYTGIEKAHTGDRGTLYSMNGSAEGTVIAVGVSIGGFYGDVIGTGRPILHHDSGSGFYSKGKLLGILVACSEPEITPRGYIVNADACRWIVRRISKDG